ncbi:MAG: fimbria/pilus periplasmic chaperone [Steroidobacteraceae bacterium]|nr:fimbria/pilus periplasmic chaperone [Steroidobacteraceae bacterium]
MALLVAAPAVAGEFAVNPVRLDLGAAARSGALEVRNEGEHPLGFQVQAKEWTQDAQGKDQYLDTADLVFFPKVMTVEPRQERVVRVGIKRAVTTVEKTYRLYIEELPSNVRAGEAKGAQINLLIRFGAPIFVAPLKPEDGLQLLQVDVVKGEVSLSARNTGNRHQVIQGIHLRGADATGKEVYALSLADRYLLAGATKTYRTAIPADRCKGMVSLTVEYKTDRLTTARKLDLSPAQCNPE